MQRNALVTVLCVMQLFLLLWLGRKLRQGWGGRSMKTAMTQIISLDSRGPDKTSTCPVDPHWCWLCFSSGRNDQRPWTSDWNEIKTDDGCRENFQFHQLFQAHRANCDVKLQHMMDNFYFFVPVMENMFKLLTWTNSGVKGHVHKCLSLS